MEPKAPMGDVEQARWLIGALIVLGDSNKCDARARSLQAEVFCLMRLMAKSTGSSSVEQLSDRARHIDESRNRLVLAIERGRATLRAEFVRDVISDIANAPVEWSDAHRAEYFKAKENADAE